MGRPKIKPTLTRHPSMIQRSLLRQSRASCSKLYNTPRTVPFRFHSPPARISFIPISRASPSRCYSETKTEPTTSDQAPPSEQTAPEAETVPAAEDPLKKELDTKNKEIVDLKVGTAPPAPSSTLSANVQTTGQVPPFRG